MYLISKNKKIEIIMCESIFSRFKGFMLKKKIKNCLCFPKCNSIHTFFMLSNIDIIMTDKENKVVYIKNNLKPCRIIFPKKDVYYTYELNSNSNSYKINDYLKIEK